MAKMEDEIVARTRKVTVAIALVGLVGGVLAGAGTAAASRVADSSGEVGITATGQATGSPQLIDQRTNPPGVEVSGQAEHAPLGIDGKPTGTDLSVAATVGHKVLRGSKPPVPGGPNSADESQPGPLVPAPTTVNSNFDGINQAGGGGAQPSDINASVGPTQILETVNRRVSVFTKAGGLLCSNTLAGWLGLGTTNVFDPRTMYDNLNDRFVIIASTTGTAGAAPRLFLAASLSGNACGGYWVYTLTFTGGLYPAGALLDYPYLGQDRVAILSSTNNFNPGYINSAAWSVSKAQVYAGAAVSFSAFAVVFSTAPVTVGGNPIAPAANTYFVAGRPNFGYNLYRMTNSAGPGTTMVLQAAIASTYGAPPRRVNQCGTTVTLDPLDGRIAWAPVQAANSPFIWFTHGANIGGFPGVRYGAIGTTANNVTAALAFHSGTSDDFNPSIGAFEETPNSFYLSLNWAYTDQPACVNTSTTVNGVAPGGGVPNLVATDLTLAVGSVTTTNTRFGDYSSVHIDPAAASGTCPAGRTALLAQQYFVGGAWATRLTRVSFGPGC
jgi:hypothetical protein